jgi:hypothetical protein
MKPAHILVALAIATAAVTIQPAHAAAGAPLQGEVLETRDVEGYTYLRLATPGGETWAAVPTAKVKKGERVTVVNTAVMNNFQSKTLGRTFDSIVFGQLGSGAAPAAAVPAEPRGNPPAATAAAAPKPIKVAKAGGADARTVAEIYKGKAALKDKPVTLRAQVVKVNNGIMGKNWLHLQDGSGSATGNDQDIVVTTQGNAAVGDVVTVKGTVRADVDVGMGYRYAVMIENGALGK